MNNTSKSLCGFVVGMALLGCVLPAQADQNGKRERGAAAVAQQASHSQQARGGGNRDRNDARGHQDRGRDDRGGHSSRDRDDRRDDHGRHDRGRDDHRRHDRDDDHHRHGNHHRGRSHSDFSFEIHVGSHYPQPRYTTCEPVIYRAPCPPPKPTWAQIEYQRGVEAGRCAGFDTGKYAGLNCLPFCDEPTVCFDRVSSHFRAGYLSAYSCAYRDGYAAGDHERKLRSVRPVVHTSVSFRW